MSFCLYFVAYQSTLAEGTSVLPELESMMVDLEKPENFIAPADEDGGHMVLTLAQDITIDLATGKISLMYENPWENTHSVIATLYLTIDNEQVLLLQTGLIPPGHGLYELQLPKNVHLGQFIGMSLNGQFELQFIRSESAFAEMETSFPIIAAIK